MQLGVSQTWFAKTSSKQKVAGSVWRETQIPFGIVSGRASVVKKLINMSQNKMKMLTVLKNIICNYLIYFFFFKLQFYITVPLYVCVAGNIGSKHIFIVTTESHLSH